MSCRIIRCLLFFVFTFLWAEGQFPSLCSFMTSLKNKECCWIPKGFSVPCGSDGNRGTYQELIIRDCSFKYSHYQPFQKGDERYNWPHALYHKTCKCNSNFAGYDCSKCEFGYYGRDCTQKKTPTCKNFHKLPAEDKDLNTWGTSTCPGQTTYAIMWWLWHHMKRSTIKTVMAKRAT